MPCARRAACRASMPPSISISSRSTSNCAPCRRQALAALHADLARALRRRARGAAAAGRQRVLRRPAGAPVREDGARLERTHGRPGRRWQPCAWRWRPASRPSRRCCPRRRSAPRPSSARPGRALAGAIGARLQRDGGWALIVDYGHDGALGASLQAVRGHRGADMLDRPGETDLSAHVDFAALARCDRRRREPSARWARATSCGGSASRSAPRA